MVWAGFQQNESFENLARELRNVLPGGNMKKPIPHITLARINSKKDSPNLILPGIEPFMVSVYQMELWESIVGDSHPEYKCLKTFTFKK